MRKIKLHLESLVVESFHTAPAGWDPGTIEGRELTIGCESGTCIPSGDGTCGRSCPLTCEPCNPSGDSCPGEQSCDFCTDPPGNTPAYSCVWPYC